MFTSLNEPTFYFTRARWIAFNASWEAIWGILTILFTLFAVKKVDVQPFDRSLLKAPLKETELE